MHFLKRDNQRENLNYKQEEKTNKEALTSLVLHNKRRCALWIFGDFFGTRSFHKSGATIQNCRYLFSCIVCLFHTTKCMRNKMNCRSSVDYSLPLFLLFSCCWKFNRTTECLFSREWHDKNWKRIYCFMYCSFGVIYLYIAVPSSETLLVIFSIIGRQLIHTKFRFP
jgi:hypothetical protein